MKRLLGILFLLASVSSIAQGADLTPGTFQETTEKVSASGKYNYSDGKVSEERKFLYPYTRLILIPNRQPCDAKAQYTVMIDRFYEHFYCVDQAALKGKIKAHKDGKIEYIDILDYVALKYCTPEEKTAAKAIQLAFEGNIPHWAKTNTGVPVGRYFFTYFPFDLRGPYESILKDGKPDGFRKAKDTEQAELLAYKNYFLVENQAPCDKEKDHTIRLSEGKDYYCIEKKLFARVMSPHNIIIPSPGTKNTKVVEHLVEGVDLNYVTPAVQAQIKKEVDNRFRTVSSKFEGRGEKPLHEISPFEKIESEKDKPFKIQVYDYKSKDVNGYLISYHGLLYGLCGGQCKLQGYTVVMDGKGKIIKFLDSTLAQTAVEYDISEAGHERIIKLANNEADALKTLFDKTPTLNEDYSARMSKETLLWGAGNSVGTFQLHISLVREKLNLTKDYPIFKWP